MKSGSFAYVVSTITTFIIMYITYVTRDWVILEIIADLTPQKPSVFKKVINAILHFYPVIYLYKIILKLLDSKIKFPRDEGKL